MFTDLLQTFCSSWMNKTLQNASSFLVIVSMRASKAESWLLDFVLLRT